MTSRIVYPVQIPGALSLALMEAAAHCLQAAARKLRPDHKLRRRQNSLKPGPETPLWNELAAAAEARLVQHGEQARLGRILGVPRQRVHELLRSRRHLPDAERTLLLLVWLQARTENRDLG
jgi:hypothetical protein